MATDYIPKRDADFQVWLDNNSAMITANSTLYGLTSGDASAYATLTSTFDAALAAATNGSTRGPSTVNAKDVARVNAEGRARQLATIVQANPSVTDEQKIDLGYTVRKTSRTPIPAPTSTPLISYIATTYLQHTLRFADQNTPDSKSRPFGAAAMQLSVWVTSMGTTPTVPPVQVLLITRNPFAVSFAPGDLGKLAFYSGRWVTSKGLMGPPSEPISKVIG